MFAADAASNALGIELIEAADGHAVARMRVTAEMVNGHDIAHGGYIFLLADTTFALACNSHGPVAVASGADITFVTPGKLGDVLTARATEKARFGLRDPVLDGPGASGDPDRSVAELRWGLEVPDQFVRREVQMWLHVVRVGVDQ
ncbi:hotdog fold thioesterase, partial [Kibdelosporangium lantanae]